MQETPDTTEQKIALIAQGIPDTEKASRLLGEIFAASDYLTVLRDHPEAQRYIDSLYEVYWLYFCK